MYLDLEWGHITYDIIGSARGGGGGGFNLVIRSIRIVYGKYACVQRVYSRSSSDFENVVGLKVCGCINSNTFTNIFTNHRQ